MPQCPRPVRLLQVCGAVQANPEGPSGWCWLGGEQAAWPESCLLPSLVFCLAGSQRSWPPWHGVPLGGAQGCGFTRVHRPLAAPPQPPCKSLSCLGTPAASWAVARIPSRSHSPCWAPARENPACSCVSLHSVLTSTCVSPPSSLLRHQGLLQFSSILTLSPGSGQIDTG